MKHWRDLSVLEKLDRLAGQSYIHSQELEKIAEKTGYDIKPGYEIIRVKVDLYTWDKFLGVCPDLPPKGE